MHAVTQKGALPTSIFFVTAPPIRQVINRTNPKKSNLWVVCHHHPQMVGLLLGFSHFPSTSKAANGMSQNTMQCADKPPSKIQDTNGEIYG
jgi:hypothetical protein